MTIAPGIVATLGALGGTTGGRGDAAGRVSGVAVAVKSCDMWALEGKDPPQAFRSRFA